MIDQLFTPKDVKKILAISLSAVYQLADRGALRCVRWDSPDTGRRRKSTVRFAMADLLKFVEDHRKGEN